MNVRFLGGVGERIAAWFELKGVDSAFQPHSQFVHLGFVLSPEH